jgi:hypothetical protein
MMAAPRRGAREPIFPGPRVNREGHRDRLTGYGVSHGVPRVIDTAGLIRLKAHGFRHRLATRLVSRGVHMRVVAEHEREINGCAARGRLDQHRRAPEGRGCAIYTASGYPGLNFDTYQRPDSPYMGVVDVHRGAKDQRRVDVDRDTC